MNTQERKLISKAFKTLEYMGSREMTNPVYELFLMELKDEKQHRGNDTARFHCTPTEAARYFTVKHIIDGACGARHAVKDILHIRLACYYGEAIAIKYIIQIEHEFTPKDIADIQMLDYVKLIDNPGGS